MREQVPSLSAPGEEQPALLPLTGRSHVINTKSVELA